MQTHQKTGRPRRGQALAAARPARASAILVCVFRGCSPSNEPPREHRTDAARPPLAIIPAREWMAPTILGVLSWFSARLIEAFPRKR